MRHSDGCKVECVIATSNICNIKERPQQSWHWTSAVLNICNLLTIIEFFCYLFSNLKPRVNRPVTLLVSLIHFNVSQVLFQTFGFPQFVLCFIIGLMAFSHLPQVTSLVQYLNKQPAHKRGAAWPGPNPSKIYWNKTYNCAYTCWTTPRMSGIVFMLHAHYKQTLLHP